jgi:hypothetical protein
MFARATGVEVASTTVVAGAEVALAGPGAEVAVELSLQAAKTPVTSKVRVINKPNLLLFLCMLSPLWFRVHQAPLTNNFRIFFGRDNPRGCLVN